MKNSRVNEIDLLRFFAALAVVFYHYTFRGVAADDMSIISYSLLAPFSKYGYLGVELFFMISGFVILLTTSKGSLRIFVVSRLIRLYPAFWVCCTITFLVAIAIGGARYPVSIGQYLVNMTMLSGFVGVPSIDGVYWSLFVEMKFYALVVVILVIGRIHQAQLFLIIWLIISVALEIFPIWKLRYLLIVDYSAYFIAGATFFLVWSKGLSLTRGGVIIMSWGLALFQAVNSLTSFEKHYNTNMSGYIVGGIITTFFLLMLLISLRKSGFFGDRKWYLAGVVTYPLYLLHQNIGYMVFNIAYPYVNPHILLWGTIVSVLGLSYIVHIYIEKRFSSLLKTNLNHFFDYIYYLAKRYKGSLSIVVNKLTISSTGKK